MAGQYNPELGNFLISLDNFPIIFKLFSDHFITIFKEKFIFGFKRSILE